MRPYRSVLFVPAHKPDWYAKAAEAGADAVVVDLEDSVPAEHKVAARAVAAEGIAALRATYPRLGILVRVNPLGSGLTGGDLDAVVRPGLDGVFTPKVDTAIDVHKYDALVDHFEHEHGVTGLEYIIPVETIHGIQNCAEIVAASPRVGAMIGPTAEHADIARAVGYEWTPEGTESLFHRTRILLATRAVGRHPLTALWERVRDLDGLRRFATQGRGMGFRGQIVIHPSHAAVVNEVYTPTAEAIDFYRGLIAAYEEAAARGEGAVMYRDVHIDKAHADKATEWLAALAAQADLHGGLPAA